MRFAYFMTEGSTLPWALRLQAEGNDVRIYHADYEYHRVGKGLVPIEDARESWIAWGLQTDSIFLFDCTSTKFDHGALADRLRRNGRLVFGGGTFCDKLEKDREFGERMAKLCGLDAPPSHSFTYLSDAIAFLKKNPKQQVGDGGWAWKSDRDLGQTYVGDPDEMIVFLRDMIVPYFGDRIKCILQERVKGVAVSTARWWNGYTFSGPFEGTIEHKKLCNEDKGPSTGCALNALWFYREPWPPIASALRWDCIEREFRKNQAPPGIYDVNAILTRGKAWFLEWTPRIGVDADLTAVKGIYNLGGALAVAVRGGDVGAYFDLDRLHMSVRVHVPPYPYHRIDVGRSLAVGTPILHEKDPIGGAFMGVGVEKTKEGLAVADPYGFVGLVAASDTSIMDGYDRIYSYLDKTIKVPNLAHRTDCGEVIMEDIEEMAELGWYTTDILDEEAA